MLDAFHVAGRNAVAPTAEAAAAGAGRLESSAESEAAAPAAAAVVEELEGDTAATRAAPLPTATRWKPSTSMQQCSATDSASCALLADHTNQFS